MCCRRKEAEFGSGDGCGGFAVGVGKRFSQGGFAAGVWLAGGRLAAVVRPGSGEAEQVVPALGTVWAEAAQVGVLAAEGEGSLVASGIGVVAAQQLGVGEAVEPARQAAGGADAGDAGQVSELQAQAVRRARPPSPVGGIHAAGHDQAGGGTDPPTERGQQAVSKVALGVMMCVNGRLGELPPRLAREGAAIASLRGPMHGSPRACWRFRARSRRQGPASIPSPCKAARACGQGTGGRTGRQRGALGPCAEGRISRIERRELWWRVAGGAGRRGSLRTRRARSGRGSENPSSDGTGAAGLRQHAGWRGRSFRGSGPRGEPAELPGGCRTGVDARGTSEAARERAGGDRGLRQLLANSIAPVIPAAWI